MPAHRAPQGLVPAVHRQLPLRLIALVKGNRHGHQHGVATSLAERFQVLQQTGAVQEELEEEGRGRCHTHHSAGPQPLAEPHLYVHVDAAGGEDLFITRDGLEVLPQHLLRRQPWEERGAEREHHRRSPARRRRAPSTRPETLNLAACRAP